jgi:Ca2+-binding EF-hand superfamily protein
MRSVILAAAAAALLPCLAVSDNGSATSSGAPAHAARDVQDLVYLADSGPVLIRLHIRVDGKPLHDAWGEFTVNLFHYLDLDGNGVLSQAEIDRAPKPQILLQLLRGGVFDPNAVRNRQALDLGVSLVAGKVKREGLANYYRLSGVEPFMAFVRDRSGQSDSLTEAMFRHLGADKDGRLSKDELLAAPTTLGKLDLNDDEMIDREEILPSLAGGEPGRPIARERVELLSDESAFMVLLPEDSPTRLAYVLMTRYDKDKNQKLSRTEISLAQSVFEQLDRDQDGELDARELAKFLKVQPPHLEVTVELGSSDNVYLSNPDSPLLAATRRTENDLLAMTLGDSHLDLGASGGSFASFSAIRQFLLNQFQMADITKRGYLDSTQGEQNPFLRDLFASADRDGDGKLYAKELATYLDLLGQAVASSTVLLITDHGRGLFELLNVHHDGRLRQRELRSAWNKLATWDKSQAGFLTRRELPHQFELVLSRGQSGALVPIGDVTPPPGSGIDLPSMTSARGPLWFRKMDRNGDGLVSLREFLGSTEDFKRIDTDGDGLLSPEEAERYDAQVRKQRSNSRN